MREGKFRAELSLRGLLLLSLLALSACRVPSVDGDPAGPGLLELLNLEIKNDELLARKLRRRQALLTRQIRSLHSETVALGEQKMQALRRQVGPRRALAKALADLHFLEGSLAKAEERGKEVADALRKIAANEKSYAALKKRGAELPGLIKGLQQAQAALERQVAQLRKKNATEAAELDRLKGKAKSSAKQPAAKETAGKKAPAKK